MPSLVQVNLIPNGDALYGTGIAFTILAGLAVVLRLMSKITNHAPFGADDLCISTGFVLWLIEQGCGLAALDAGKAATSLTDPRFKDFRKWTYIGSFFYFPAGALVRIGIVFFYRRIFQTAAFHRISLVVLVLCVLLGISTSLVQGFSCVPANSNWDPSVTGGKCIDFRNFFIAACSLELGLDTAILVIPLREVYKLRMSKKKKILVSFIFFLGVFAVITGLVRIVLSARSAKINLEADVLWMQVHMGTFIICACLPTYRPLFVAALKWVATTIGSGSTTRAPYQSGQLATANMQPPPKSGLEKATREFHWVEETNHSDIALVKLKDEGRLVRTARF